MLDFLNILVKGTVKACVFQIGNDSFGLFSFSLERFLFRANDYLKDLICQSATCPDKHQKTIFSKSLQFFDVLSLSLG